LPNFEAKIRRDYRDINGLVLDLNRSGIITDPVTSRVTEWRNDAPPLIKSDPTYPRYLNAVQADPTVRGLLGSSGGVPHVIFDNALSEHMTLDMVGDFGGQKTDYTFAYEIDVLGGDATAVQSIFGADEVDLYGVGTGANNLGYRLDGTSIFQGFATPANSVTVYQQLPANMVRWENGVSILSSAVAAVTLGDSTINPVATLAGNNSGGGFFDGNLRNMRVWNRVLQDAEINLAFQSLASDPAVDHSVAGLATITTKVWTDGTSVPPRINPTLRAPHFFLLATIPTGGTGIIHLEATIGGVVLPDSGLGGDLFSVNALETPDGVPPLTAPLAVGWSSIQSVRLEAEGHYTIEMRRPSGGAIIFHIDVEEV